MVSRIDLCRSLIWLLVCTVSFLSSVASAELPEFTALIEQHSPAVVKIHTVQRQAGNGPQLLSNPEVPEFFRQYDPRALPEQPAQAIGSGFLISVDGYILTNNHVVKDADEINVRLSDRREFMAKVIGVDERSDLALLKIEANDLPFLEFAASHELKVGEWVLAIGSPFGLDYSASAGIVSAIGRSLPTEKNENYVPFIQTDVAINPGNSGGPLFNLKGQVVGINSQIFTRSGGSIGLSFAIPSEVALVVVEQLKAKGHVDRGWLGLVVQEVNRDLAASFGLERAMGALVAQMEPRGPAERAGIKIGDIIVEFDGMPVNESADLPHIVGAMAPGKRVPIKVMREGKKYPLVVEVGTLGSADAVSQSTTATAIIGRLGMDVQDLDEAMRNSLQLAGGVVVARVVPNSAASQAGLQPGDVVAQLGFREITNVAEYTQIESALPAKQLLPIRYFRRGRPAFDTIRIDN